MSEAIIVTINTLLTFDSPTLVQLLDAINLRDLSAKVAFSSLTGRDLFNITPTIMQFVLPLETQKNQYKAFIVAITPHEILKELSLDDLTNYNVNNSNKSNNFNFIFDNSSSLNNKENGIPSGQRITDLKTHNKLSYFTFSKRYLGAFVRSELQSPFVHLSLEIF